MAIELRFKLTASDFAAGLRLHRPADRASRLAAALACLMLIGLGGALLLVPGSPAVVADLRKWAAVSISVGVALLALQVAQHWTLKKTIRTRAAAEEETHFVVGEQGFQAAVRGARSEVTWERVRSFKESPEYFLVYQSPDQYFILPKRAFGGEGDVGALRAMLVRAGKGR